ncbi:MAG: hypothetical protein NXI24_15735 [bacterium]|nr:hypothetical protein [bacterium]
MSELQKYLALGRGYLRDGHEIFAEWDAGGDETLVNVRIEGSYEVESDFRQALRYKIKDVLNLPNAGERYHEGRGRVLLEDDVRLVLRFDAEDSYANEDRFYFDDEQVRLVPYDSNDPRLAQRVRLRSEGWHDPDGIAELLARGELRLAGIVDSRLSMREFVRLRADRERDDGAITRKRDSIVLSEKAIGYYRLRIREILEATLEDFGNALADGEIAALYIEAATHTTEGAEFFVEPDAFIQYRLHRNDRVVLLGEAEAWW